MQTQDTLPRIRTASMRREKPNVYRIIAQGYWGDGDSDFRYDELIKAENHEKVRQILAILIIQQEQYHDTDDELTEAVNTEHDIPTDLVSGVVGQLCDPVAWEMMPTITKIDILFHDQDGLVWDVAIED